MIVIVFVMLIDVIVIVIVMINTQSLQATWCQQNPGMTLFPVTLCRCSNLNSWKDPERWKTAAEDLQLSQEQKKDFINLRWRCLDELKT